MNRATHFSARLLGSLLLCVAWAAGSGVLLAAPKSAADCASCHTDQNTKLAKSAHAALSCDTCHEKHETVPHAAGLEKPKCATCHEDQAKDYNSSVHFEETKKGNAGAPECGTCHGSAHELLRPKSEAFHKGIPDTCGMCHSDIATQFKASIHGKAVAEGVSQAPVCTTCHGEHALLRHTNVNSPVNRTHIRETCAGCHSNVQLSRQMHLPEDRVVSFDESFHGLAAKAGNQTVANCASCHGIHNILPSSDPKSTINAKNLPKTCGQCHPGAGKRFAITQVHVAGKTPDPLLAWVKNFYAILIPLTIGLMLLHNAGDWFRKLLALRSRKGRIVEQVPAEAYSPELRMFRFERFQHALTAVSFIVLVWTGFALKYPDQWWARPLVATENLRSVVHRIAAIVFVVVSVIHAISLVVNRRLRKHWMEMLPRVQDVSEAAANFSYNVGLRDDKPSRSAHSYVEKAEYWAVIWGAIVMAGTGFMLWANNLMMAWFPKKWLDVATSVHFYEAVLAALAIAVWHFYSVIFDPDVYPLDTTWLTGYSVRKHEPHSKESEHAEAGKEDQPVEQ